MNNEIFEKVAHFNKVALEEINSLRLKVAQYEEQAEKQAEKRETEQDRFKAVVKQAADALYNADFIIDSYTYRDFIKKASVNPSHLGKAIEKICSYKDVSGIGIPSSITVVKTSAAEDPIYARAFGRSGSDFNLLED